jgi:hypothetical protein
MKIGVAVDANGFFVMDFLEGMTLDEGLTLVTVPCPDGFYRPRWDGTAWVEGLSQEEIDAIINAPKPRTLEDDVTDLKQQNAQLLIALAQKDLTINALKQQNATIMLTLARNNIK